MLSKETTTIFKLNTAIRYTHYLIHNIYLGYYQILNLENLQKISNKITYQLTVISNTYFIYPFRIVNVNKVYNNFNDVQNAAIGSGSSINYADGKFSCV